MSAVVASTYAGRNTLRALNEVDLLREVLIREVRALGTMYVVGKRRPITELSLEKQEQIRAAYRDTLWASDYCVEMMGICTSQALAEQTVKEHGPNWFCCKLPIDSVLTEETVQGEWAVRFPESDAASMYENLTASTIAMSITQFRMIEQEAERLLEIVRNARETLSSP